METTTKSMKPIILVLIFCPYHIDNGIKTKSKNAENHVEKKNSFSRPRMFCMRRLDNEATSFNNILDVIIIISLRSFLRKIRFLTYDFALWPNICQLVSSQLDLDTFPMALPPIFLHFKSNCGPKPWFSSISHFTIECQFEGLQSQVPFSIWVQMENGFLLEEIIFIVKL